MIKNIYEAVKETIGTAMETSIKVLKELLFTYKYEDKEVIVHYKTDNVNIASGSIIPDEIEIENEEVYFSGDDFMLHVEKEIKDIEFIEEEDEVIVTLGQEQEKIYFDFI